MATRGKYSKSSLALGIFSAVLGWELVTFAQVPDTKPLPDDETFNYLNQKYSLLIKETRSACGYYIDPRDIYQQGNSKVTMVKVSAGPRGTACHSILQFVLLQVNCQTKDISYGTPEGVPTTWKIEHDTNSEVAQTVCSLPARQTL